MDRAHSLLTSSSSPLSSAYYCFSTGKPLFLHTGIEAPSRISSFLIVCLGLFSDTRVNQWAFYLCSLLTDRHLTASCAGEKQPRSTVPLSRNFYMRRHVNFTPENEKNRTSLNFYFCTRPFIHCFYFIYARKIYMRTQVKITLQWKSTLSRFT